MNTSQTTEDTGPGDGVERCPTCNAKAHFVGHLGAPGVGSAWRCGNGHKLWRRSTDDPLIDYRELTPADVELSEWEVV